MTSEAERPLSGNRDLDEFLDNLFRRKLALPYENPEVLFVQTAIECLVSKIVTDLIENKDTVFDKVGDPAIHEHLIVNSDNVLCKVGSFYERTRNTYPNEFDFVYVPYSLILTNTTKNSFLKLNVTALRNRISNLAHLGCLTLKDNHFGEIKFDRYVGQHGPASNVRFFFTRFQKVTDMGEQTTKEIDVDLVPGIRIIDPYLATNITKVCPIPGFQEEVLKTGFYFWVPYSFTALNETEVHFMRNVLSAKHAKAYRLLKYVINGDKDGGDLEDECVTSDHHIKCSIPSYAIKTAMILHHFRCQNDDENLGDCIIDILEWFRQKFSQPVQKQRDNFQHFHVDIVAPSNKVITLAIGGRDLIRYAEISLCDVIDFMKTYRKKKHGHDHDIDSFSTHMLLRVMKYDAIHGPWYRRHKYIICRRCGVTLTAKCCYNFVVVLLLIVIAFVLAYVFYPREEEL